MDVSPGTKQVWSPGLSFRAMCGPEGGFAKMGSGAPGALESTQFLLCKEKTEAREGKRRGLPEGAAL